MNLPGFGLGGKSKQILRYLLWLALVWTARANHRHFGLITTWLPHLLGNSLALLMPELYRAADHLFDLAVQIRRSSHPNWAALRRAFEQVVCDNPDYVDYIAPLTLAYVVSHPQFNIYRGRWGKLSLFGFGLDSLPHAGAAYSLTRLTLDSLSALAAETPARAVTYKPVTRLAGRKALVSGLVLAGLTLLYETVEYLIYRSELEARNHDESRINMVWSVKDTVFDVLANAIGWVLAIWRSS